MCEPGLDQAVITFPGIHCRVLRTPAECFESASQIMGMVLDAKFDQNQGADPAERPPIRVKAGLQCASTQDLQQQLPLLCRQAWRTSRHWSVLQTPKITLAVAELLGPCTDSRTTDAHLARDGRAGKVASLQQSTGFQAAFFKLRTGELSWSPYHETIVNQLRRTSIMRVNSHIV
jgi:hypothetical protein